MPTTRFGGDVDVFSFTAVAGRLYAVTCTGSSYDMCALTIKNAGGNSLGSAYSGQSTQAQFKAAAAGTFTVEVRGSSTSNGTYTLTVTDAGTDDHGDTPATATTITLGAVVYGNVQFDGDVDWFAISLPAGGTYTATALGTFATVRAYLPGGTTLTGTNDYESTTFTTASAGIYLLKVQGELVDDLGPYTLQVQ